ncbi:MAG: hypothetical protein JKY54_08195 [Flavobacteriales bacterium]|nr:hypothetical protein [Flavobacteriales bacterium]
MKMDETRQSVANETPKTNVAFFTMTFVFEILPINLIRSNPPVDGCRTIRPINRAAIINDVIKNSISFVSYNRSQYMPTT